MLPEDVVLQLKRNGVFDELRKQLLKDFQSSAAGTQFDDRLGNFIENRLLEDPNLLEKNSASFYEYISSELEKSDIYSTLREHLIEKLKEKTYQDRIDAEIRTMTEQNVNEEQQ